MPNSKKDKRPDNPFVWSEDDVEAMAFLRSKAVQFRERGELYEDQGQSNLVVSMSELVDGIPNVIGYIIANALVEWAGDEEYGLDSHSELYDDCDTLGKAIARFCYEWGLGLDPEMMDALDDLREEINICYGVEK